MKKILLLNTLITLIVLNGFSQNLVNNFSFENVNYTSCEIVDEFSEIVVNWNSPNDGEGDVYFTNISQNCYYYQPNSTYSGPLGFKGTETPSTGQVFAGIWVYTIDGLEQREYIRGELSSTLEAGNTYRVKMKISLADFMESYIGELGIAFMENQTVETNGDLVVAEPQLTIISGLNVSDGWIEFDETFVSDGAYNYFIIGNFKSDDNTSLFPNPQASEEPGTYGAYYFLDDISVELEMLNSTDNFEEPKLEVYPTLVNEQFKFKMTGSNTFFKYKIVNQLGQILKEDNIDNRAEGVIDCRFLEAGIYYFIGQDDQGVLLSTTKFVKVE